jgi:hypothetical protein
VLGGGGDDDDADDGTTVYLLRTLSTPTGISETD